MKTLNYFILSLFFFMLLSCDNKEETPIIKLVTVQLPEFLFEDNTSVYVMASDESGKTLDYQLISPGETVTLEANDFRQPTFTFSYVSIDDENLFGNSFHEVPVGLSLISPNENDYYAFDLKSNNFEADIPFYQISIYGGLTSFFSDNENQLLNGLTNNSPYFITKYETDDDDFEFPSSYYFSEQNSVVANSVQNINLNQNYQLFESDLLLMNNNLVPFSNQVIGLPDWNNLNKSLVLSNNYNYEGFNLEVKHTGSLFPRYASYNSGMAPQYDFFSFNNNAKHDFEMPVFNIVDVSPINNYTVNADVVAPNAFLNHLFVDYYENSYRDWVITTKSSNKSNVSIPELPNEISKDLTNFSKENFEWAQELTLSYTSDVNSLQDFLTFQFQPFDIDVPANNYKEIRWLFNDQDLRKRNKNLRKNTAQPKNFMYKCQRKFTKN